MRTDGRHSTCDTHHATPGTNKAMGLGSLSYRGSCLFPIPCAPSKASTIRITSKCSKSANAAWGGTFHPESAGGLTIPLDGYKNYDNSPNASLDVYFRPPVPQFPEWSDRMMFRLSGEYFPLEVPSEVKGVVEDLYALTGTVLFRIMRMDGTPENKRWIPYIGGGAGVFWDRIKLDYPGMSSTDSVDTFFGLTGSVGILLPAIGPIRMVPEVRYYSFKRSNGIWANHMSYQIGLVYWLPSKMEE
jgi:hypothetical protein